MTTYGGIFLAIANQYTTNLQLEFVNNGGWEFLGTQSEASIAYARGIGSLPSCNVYFIDPTSDLLQGMRQLIFRTAVASANRTNIQHVTARATGTRTIYHTSYLFLALASLASVLAAVTVLLTFHGFWCIGRKVSMSPIETGKAFNAPILRNSDSNAPARSLLKQVGTRLVKYGVVSEMVGSERAASANKGDDIGKNANVVSPRGCLDLPDTTREGQPQSAVVSAVSKPHTSSQSAFSTGCDREFEMIDQGEKSTIPTLWLELADPNRVAPITSGVALRG